MDKFYHAKPQIITIISLKKTPKSRGSLYFGMGWKEGGVDPVLEHLWGKVKTSISGSDHENNKIHILLQFVIIITDLLSSKRILFPMKTLSKTIVLLATLSETSPGSSEKQPWLTNPGKLSFMALHIAASQSTTKLCRLVCCGRRRSICKESEYRYG